MCGYYLRIHGNYLRVVSNQRTMVAHSGLLRNGRAKKKKRRRRSGGTHVPKDGFLALLQATRICKDRHERWYVC